MMGHDPRCGCGICAEVRARSLATIQGDREVLADAWSRWRGDTDGEVNKLRAGEDGAPGSTRWIALQAIAAVRIACEAIAAERRVAP